MRRSTIREKRRKLLAAMEAEKVSSVSSSTMGSIFGAHKAAAYIDDDTTLQKKREKIEKEGLVFKITIPAPAVLENQQHMKYYVDNKRELLEKLDHAQCVFSQNVPVPVPVAGAVPFTQAAANLFAL